MTTSLKNKIIATLEDIKAVNPVAINVKKLVPLQILWSSHLELPIDI